MRIYRLVSIVVDTEAPVRHLYAGCTDGAPRVRVDRLRVGQRILIPGVVQQVQRFAVERRVDGTHDHIAIRISYPSGSGMWPAMDVRPMVASPFRTPVCVPVT